MNWREHPLLAFAGLILVLLVAVFLIGRGCSCGSNRPRAIPSPAATAKETNPAGKPKKVWTDDCPEPPNWGREDETPKAAAKSSAPPTPQIVSDADKGSAPAQANKSARPQDVADWTPKDFQTAKRENDPQLIEAVAYFGRQIVTPEGAEFLAKLLEPSSSDAVAARTPVGPLVETVVAALAANRTATARQILERLVAGTQKSVDPQLAARESLKSLLQHAGPNTEELLYRIITAAPTNAAPAGPDNLRKMAIDWIKSSASESLRLRLANSMTVAEVTPAAYDELWAALSDARVENMAAQTALYRSGRPADQVRQSLERQFAEQSRRELLRLLGCDSPDAAGISGQDGHQAAALLWTESFAKLIDERLRAAQGSDRGLPLLSLASTIPNSAMRATVFQLMEQYWEEGPKRFEPLASDKSLPEPGFLLLVKQMPRKHASATPNNGGSRSGSWTSGSKAAKLAAARQVKERQEQAAQQWLAFSEKLVQAMCGQYRDVAFRHPDARETPAGFPLKLPASAVVVASHHVDWPGELPPALAGLSLPAMRVCYVRIERRARPDRIAAYFRRQLPAVTVRINDRGAWLDEFSVAKKSGLMRSVDVLISKPNKDLGMLIDQEQQVILELLTVECMPKPTAEVKNVDDR